MAYLETSLRLDAARTDMQSRVATDVRGPNGRSAQSTSDHLSYQNHGNGQPLYGEEMQAGKSSLMDPVTNGPVGSKIMRRQIGGTRSEGDLSSKSPLMDPVTNGPLGSKIMRRQIGGTRSEGDLSSKSPLMDPVTNGPLGSKIMRRQIGATRGDGSITQVVQREVAKNKVEEDLLNSSGDIEAKLKKAKEAEAAFVPKKKITLKRIKYHITNFFTPSAKRNSEYVVDPDQQEEVKKRFKPYQQP